MTGDLTETLTAVLTEHRPAGMVGRGNPIVYRNECECGEVTGIGPAAHRAHQATVLAALVAAEREKAVLELADSLPEWREHTANQIRAYAAQMHAAATEGGDR